MEARDMVQSELDKASSLVQTAERLLATGTVIDLSALEGKVRMICDAATGMEREEGQALRPRLEALVDSLDRLAESLRDRYDPETSSPGAPG